MPAPESFTLDRPDGLRLHGLAWQPAGTAASAARTVVLVHGLGEHVGRYAALGDWLAERGWTLRGHDHRGHGRSPGRRGTLTSSHDLVDDLAAAIDALGATAPSPRCCWGTASAVWSRSPTRCAIRRASPAWCCRHRRWRPDSARSRSCCWR